MRQSKWKKTQTYRVQEGTKKGIHRANSPTVHDYLSCLVFGITAVLFFLFQNLLSLYSLVIRAAFAVGTEIKKAAWEFLYPGRTAGHGPRAEQQQSPPTELGQLLIWTARKHTKHVIRSYYKVTKTRNGKIMLAHLSWNFYKSKLFIEFWRGTSK